MRLISQDKLIDYCDKHMTHSVPIEVIKAEKPIIIGELTTIISRQSGLIQLPVCSRCSRGPLLDSYICCPYCGRQIVKEKL